MITGDYGSWATHGDRSNVSVEASIADAVSGADLEWRERMEEAGAFEKIADDYRDAIQATFPEGLWITGNEFLGLHPKDDGYTEELREFDIRSAIEGVDLLKIVERHDIDARVQVWEDNAGGVYLKLAGEKTAWSMGPVTSDREGKFAADAEGWHAGEWRPGEHDEQPTESTEGLEHIATWSEADGVEIVTRPNGDPVAGAGGQAYVGAEHFNEVTS
ncbi:hypothetical protein [Streptomyces sp. NPDC088752]|uniref:hypothetical protein n=1 Tax=Streptomyces sp. NPDC088752 TaxID=3154963 RepID=UPI003446F937